MSAVTMIQRLCSTCEGCITEDGRQSCLTSSNEMWREHRLIALGRRDGVSIAQQKVHSHWDVFLDATEKAIDEHDSDEVTFGRGRSAAAKTISTTLQALQDKLSETEGCPHGKQL